MTKMGIYKTDLVIKNVFSRPGFKLLGHKGIVLHWTANKGASDENHAEFFDGADGGGGRAASAHFFVDSDSATLIVPLDEVTFHANERACRIPKLKATAPYYEGGNANLTTIGVEMCVEKDGTIHPETVLRTIQLVAHLCKFFKLSKDDIYRHYDITGKPCPAPFVDRPVLFDNFKHDVNLVLNPVKNPNPPFMVIIPNTTLWQTRNLVIEYTTKGHKAWGLSAPSGEKDGCPFVIYTDYYTARTLVQELKDRGYPKAHGEEITA